MLNWLRLQQEARLLGFPARRIHRFDGSLAFIEEEIEQRGSLTTVKTYLVSDAVVRRTNAHYFPAETDYLTAGYNERLRDVAVRNASYVLVVQAIIRDGHLSFQEGVSWVYLTRDCDLEKVAKAIERYQGHFSISSKHFKRPATLAAA